MGNLVELGFAVAVGTMVVSYLVWSVRRQQLFMQRLVENHMTHNTQVVLELRAAIQQLGDGVAALNAWLRARE